jgi:hypothetical protein
MLAARFFQLHSFAIRRFKCNLRLILRLLDASSRTSSFWIFVVGSGFKVSYGLTKI